MKRNRKLKKSDSPSKLELEEIIGTTTKNSNGLASNLKTANCVYLAGCVVVLYNVNRGTQSHLMVPHRLPKPLSCVAMSQDGRFVAAGESGPQPAVFVWDSATMAFLSELKGHLYGVACLAFSPDGKYLVSVGGYIYLWDWRNTVLLTKLKASSSCTAISSVSFLSDAKSILTAGKKHLKFWTITSPRTQLNLGTGSLSLHGKPVNLGPNQGSSFISVTPVLLADGSCSETFTMYALTEAGVLCLVNSGFSVTKSVNLKVDRSFSVSASSKLVACACSNGMIQLFDSESLHHVGSLIYSRSKKFYGLNNVVCHTKDEVNVLEQLPALPDAVSCCFSTSEKLVVVYGDHYLNIWDIHDVKQATRSCVLVSHSACIWDIKVLCCEKLHDASLACVARGCSGGVSFATCSADGTIRLWDLSLQSDSDKAMDSQTRHVDTTCLVSAGIFERNTVEAGSSSIQGFRSLAVSSDGKFLAAGDCDGNIHVYNLLTSDYTCLQGAHDAEVLSLSFGLLRRNDIKCEQVLQNPYHLASASRDRIIHLFDVERNFDLIDSIADHSAAVTSVKLSCNGCKIISCSADRSLIFRNFTTTDPGHIISRSHHQMAAHGTIYDMAIDPKTDVVVTVGQDKKINTFDIASGKLIRSFRQDKDFGEPIKVTLDPSCSYLVCSYSNKSIFMHDAISGEVVLQGMGHSEVITGVIFTPDCKRIISIGGDGCIFVWRVPALLYSRMHQRINEMYGPLSPRSLAQHISLSQTIFHEEDGDEEKQRISNHGNDCQPGDSNQVGLRMLHQGGAAPEATFRFSISRLPRWAQQKVTNTDSAQTNLDSITLQRSHSSLADDDIENAPLSPEIQICSEYIFGRGNSNIRSLSSNSSDNSNSGSHVPQETFSHHQLGMDNRWLSIYNVCMDLLNSPELQNSMDRKLLVSSTNILQDAGKIAGYNNGCSFDQISQARDIVGGEFTSSEFTTFDNSGPASKCDLQMRMHNINECNEAISSEMEEQSSCMVKSEKQAAGDISLCSMESEDSDLFKLHFGSLSTLHKKSESSIRRRYSTKYLVQKDYLGSSKTLSGTPTHDSACRTLYAMEEEPNHSLSEDFQCPVIAEQQLDITRTEENSLNEKSYFSQSEKSPGENDPKRVKLTKGHDYSFPIASELQEQGTNYREVLLSLDAAADNAVRFFSRLDARGSCDDSLCEPGSELYDEAAKLLPSIVEKVNAVAKLVQRRNKDTSGSLDDVSGVEPLLGTFAENLSQKAVEILKKNLGWNPLGILPKMTFPLPSVKPKRAGE